MNRRLPHVAETVSTTGIIGSNFTWHIDVSESLSYVGLCFPVGWSSSVQGGLQDAHKSGS